MNHLRTPALLLVLVAGVTFAAPANDAQCRAVGAAAGRIAALRDAGRSLDEAVATVAAEPFLQDPQALRISAALLYARFRLMPPENAAFEFYLDCLDDEDSAAPPIGAATRTPGTP